MRNIHFIKYLFIFLLLLSPSSIHASDYKSNFQTIPAVERMPPRVGTWKYTPTILVCEHAPVDEISVESATEWWRQHGFSFYRTIYKRDI